MKCSVDTCQKRVIARNLCTAHYQRLMRVGRIDSHIQVGDKTGARNPRWKGGESKMNDGRVLVFCPDHPFAGVAGVYVLRYRLVMEKHLGRYLQPAEVVHHINGDCSDDRIENLRLVTPSEHSRLHWAEWRKAGLTAPRPNALKQMAATEATR